MRMKIIRPWVEVDANPASVQRIMPPNRSERFEGVDFSASGNVLAIATPETNSVLLFRRKADGRFEDTPYQIIGRTRLNYPHDVSFSNWKDGELLAVAQRAGALAIYAKNRPDWPAPGSADTELGVLMEPEVSHGKAEVYTRVQA